VKTLPDFVRSVRGGSNHGAANSFATFAASICLARTITERLAEDFANREVTGYALGLRDRLPTDPLTNEEEKNVALKLTQREVDGVTVVALDGRIVLGDESNALREKVKSLLSEGKKKIVLNMDNITFIDSAGLGTLVASHHTAKKEGASLRLCHLGSKFQEVLQITKLLTVFEVYDTEAAAVASFSK
jgi:anti-sigma B factor antagonist